MATITVIACQPGTAQPIGYPMAMYFRVGDTFQIDSSQFSDVATGGWMAQVGVEAQATNETQDPPPSDMDVLNIPTDQA